MGETKMQHINKRSVLEEMKEMAWHNVLCYSGNYAMTEPKDGMREDWEKAVAKAKIIDCMLDELPIHIQYDEVMKTRRYFRKYVGHIGAWSVSTTKTENPHPYVSKLEFDLEGFGVSDADNRILHINHQLGIDFLLSGQYDIDRHERYDEGKTAKLQIMVDNLGYIQEMRWADDGEICHA
jgi:hypothetical protein